MVGVSLCYSTVLGVCVFSSVCFVGGRSYRRGQSAPTQEAPSSKEDDIDKTKTPRRAAFAPVIYSTSFYREGVVAILLLGHLFLVVYVLSPLQAFRFVGWWMDKDLSAGDFYLFFALLFGGAIVFSGLALLRLRLMCADDGSSSSAPFVIRKIGKWCESVSVARGFVHVNLLLMFFCAFILSYPITSDSGVLVIAYFGFAFGLLAGSCATATVVLEWAGRESCREERDCRSSLQTISGVVFLRSFLFQFVLAAACFSQAYSVLVAEIVLIGICWVLFLRFAPAPSKAEEGVKRTSEKALLRSDGGARQSDGVASVLFRSPRGPAVFVGFFGLSLVVSFGFLVVLFEVVGHDPQAKVPRCSATTATNVVRIFAYNIQRGFAGLDKICAKRFTEQLDLYDRYSPDILALTEGEMSHPMFGGNDVLFNFRYQLQFSSHTTNWDFCSAFYGSNPRRAPFFGNPMFAKRHELRKCGVVALPSTFPLPDFVYSVCQVTVQTVGTRRTKTLYLYNVHGPFSRADREDNWRVLADKVGEHIAADAGRNETAVVVMGDLNTRNRALPTRGDPNYLKPLTEAGMVHVLNPTNDLEFDYPNTRVIPSGSKFNPSWEKLDIDHIFVWGHVSIANARALVEEGFSITDHYAIVADIGF